MGAKLANPPIFFALVQARFNALMALESYIADIQERFRKQGFPDFQKVFLTTLNLPLAASMEGAGAQPIPVMQAPRYLFANIDRTAGFVLEAGALSFQTTEYDVFETFSAQFLAGLKAVHDAVDLSYTDRIGARYLDAVFPRAHEQLADYLKPSVLGLTSVLEGSELQYAFSESLLSKSERKVLARTIIQNGSLGLPADLAQPFLPIAKRFAELTGLHAILDTDSFVEQREPFSIEQVQLHLSAIHDEIIGAFRATVTQNAMDIWSTPQ
jgi:uncharacterized protein (TIGR04255 family)